VRERPGQKREREVSLKPGFRAQFDRLLTELTSAVRSVYGDRLVSLVVFGSVGRGRQRPDSDVDILLVAETLPDGRIPRVCEFGRVDALLEPMLQYLRETGVTTSVSPVLKTPAEVLQGSLLFLDMTTDAMILFDRDGFAEKYLGNLASRLSEMGARKIWRGGSWHWVLKPDYREGEVFDI